MKFPKFFVPMFTGFSILAGVSVLASVRTLADDAPVTQSGTKEYDMNIRTDGDPVFLPGISVAGQSLEGMTLAEADAWIDNYVAARQNRAINLTVFNSDVYNYNGASFGVTLANPEVKDTLTQYITSGDFIEQYKMQKDLENSPVNLDLNLTFDQATLQQTITGLANYYYAAPTNASVTRTADGFQVIPEVYGQSFDADAITTELTSLISDWSNTDTLTYDLPYTTLTPQYTSANFAFSATPLGSYSTNNLGIDNRVHNITLSASRVNGTILYPGQSTSALDLYGAQTEDNGYLVAPGYENGQQVPAIGGGVCQTTTTLYNALIRAEVTITKRSAHSMLVTYVPPALDAAVSAGGPDLQFRNDFANPIYIEMWVDGDTLTCNVWGIDPDPTRRVDFTYEVTSVSFPDPLYNVVVDDTKATYGPDASVNQKASAEVETHPAVTAVSYKHVYVTDPTTGVETETEVTQWNSDSYRAMTGTLYIASDCNVTSTLVEDTSGNGVYRYLGYDIYHYITFKNGEVWNPATADENYTP